MRQQFLEGEAPLRGMPVVEQLVDGRIRRGAVNVGERLEKRRHILRGEYGGRNPIREVLCRGFFQRQSHQHAQPSLCDALRGRVHRREMVLCEFCGGGVDAPVFRVHDLQAVGAAARLAEAPEAHAAGQSGLLLCGEVKEPQRQGSGPVGDPAQHLASAAKRYLGEQDLALHRGALPRQQLAQRHDAGSILVAQRQQEQEILNGAHAQGSQSLGERLADAAEFRDRLVLGHRATMHSTSTCAPRGRAVTPTAARAGYGSRKYSAMTVLTMAKWERSVR